MVEKLTDNLIEYLNDDVNFPADPLLKMCIAHYQFDAIHPFSDGNGRTGRILNLPYLVNNRLLSKPVLYLSKYIIDKDEYYFSLSAITQRESWQSWILYMLNAVVEENHQTILRFKTGTEGTGVIGVSTIPKMIELSASDFTEYLKHDGIVDVLEARKKSGEERNPAKEKYSKHVKTVYQVGNKLTDDYKKSLGYPVEFTPLKNPYSLKAGDEFSVLLTKNGKPLAGELVYASYAGFHRHGDDGSHVEAVKTRTDAKGITTINLSVAWSLVPPGY